MDVGVWAAFEFLDETLSVGLEGLDTKLMLVDEGFEVFGSSGDVLKDSRVELEVDGLGFGEVGADRWVGVVESIAEDELVDVVVETVSRGTVHHGVLAEESGCAVLVDDEIEWLVIPAVGAISVPVDMGTLLKGDGRCIVETDEERGALDGLQGLLIGRAGSQEFLPGSSPEVAVGGSQGPYGWNSLSLLDDGFELFLELGGVELLAIDCGGNLEHLVLAHDNDVFIPLGRVLLRIIFAVGWDTAAIEHVLVRAHGHGLLAQVLWLKRSIIDLSLELQYRGGDGSSSLSWVPSLSVVPVRVEVADIWYNRVTVGKVGTLIPPFVQPIVSLGVLTSSN